MDTPQTKISSFCPLLLAGSYVFSVMGPEVFLACCLCPGGFFTTLVVLLGEDVSGLLFCVNLERIIAYFLTVYSFITFQSLYLPELYCN